MTVGQWIETYIWFYPGKEVRMIDATTNASLGNWWVPYRDKECLRAKITYRWIFLFVDEC